MHFRGCCFGEVCVAFLAGITDPQKDFERSFCIFRRQGDSAGTFSSWSMMIMSLQAEGNTTPIDRWIALFDDLIQEFSEYPSLEVELSDPKVHAFGDPGRGSRAIRTERGGQSRRSN